MKSQIPNPESQTNFNIQYPILDIGIWSLFGIWKLEFGFSLLICFLFLSVTTLPQAYGQTHYSGKNNKKAYYNPKYQTIAHRVLKLESESGTEPNYMLLDEITDEVRARIKLKQSYSKNEAVNILWTIDNTLLKRNFLYNGKTRLLSEALRPRKLDKKTIQHIKESDPGNPGIDFKNRETLNRIILPGHKHKTHALTHIHENFYFAECKTFSLIYLGIADAMKLPVNMVLAPSHVFVRWHFGRDRYINWETTSGIVTDDDFIRRSHDISEISVRSGVYLKSLSRTESMGLAYYMLGNSDANPDRKIKYFTKTLQLNPMHSRAWYNRSTIWYNKGMFDRALSDFDRAILLEPNHSNAFNNRGNVWHEKGDLTRALADYSKAIELNPGYSRAFNNRCAVWYRKGRLDRALADCNKAIQSDPGYSGAYNNRGNIWYEKGDLNRALADYDKAIQLNPGNTEAVKNRAEILRMKKER